MSGPGEQHQSDRDFIDALRRVLGLDPLYFFNQDHTKPRSEQWLGWMEKLVFEKPSQAPRRWHRTHQ